MDVDVHMTSTFMLVSIVILLIVSMLMLISYCFLVWNFSDFADIDHDQREWNGVAVIGWIAFCGVHIERGPR